MGRKKRGIWEKARGGLQVGNERWKTRAEGARELERECAGRGCGCEAELVTKRLLVSNGPATFYPMLRRISPAILLLLATAAPMRAAGSLGAPAPLLTEARPSEPGAALATLGAARNALAVGLPSLAAGLYEQLLGATAEPMGATRDGLRIELATARLGEGDTAAAERALQGVTGVRTAAWHLRAGLVAARQRRWETARTELAAAGSGPLAADDRAWLYFLQGMTLDAARDFDKSRAAYDQAANAAASDAQRAEFARLRDLARQNMGDVTTALAEELRANAERYAGTATGHGYARQYAVALAALGRRDEAVRYLLAKLRELPTTPAAADAPTTRKARDNFRLLLGIVAGAQAGEGRDKLGELLADSDDRELQLEALQLLAAASLSGAARKEFRGTLKKLIERRPEHAQLADLLLARAQLSLADKNFTEAEKDALELLEKFSGSALRPAALATLASAAWERGSYRAAANRAGQAREAVAVGDARRAGLGLLTAEAWFRAGTDSNDPNDFKNAAAAYAVALEEPPTGVTTGGLIFQQAFALMRAALWGEASEFLDNSASDTRLDPVNRWRAEWNLARELLAHEADGARQALTRVSRLLADTPPVSAAQSTGLIELQTRMRWLQAKLSLDAGETARAQELAHALRESLQDGAAQASGLRDEVAAEAWWLEARAAFARNNDDEALGLFRGLREAYPKSDAAMRSYLDEADYHARPGPNQKIQKIVEAEALLQELADKFPDDRRHAPEALFQKALLEAQRGEEFYENAFKFLEDMLAKYSDSDLVFQARMQQGDLKRRLGQLPQAQQIYELVVRDFATHGGVREAELALADCHAAQVPAPDGPTHYENALTGYRRLQDLADASPDLRIEAGYKLGVLLTNKTYGDPALAAQVWHALAAPFLDAGSGRPRPPELSVDGRVWLDKALNSLADQLTTEGKLEQARNVLTLVTRLGLPSAPAVGDRLLQLGGAAPEK
jgi:tetratricopeptide (TPR) repeat protein